MRDPHSHYDTNLIDLVSKATCAFIALLISAKGNMFAEDYCRADYAATR